jgi:amidase
MPLAPTYDAVGILARSADVLQRAGCALLAGEPIPDAVPERIHLVTEAFALADPEARAALAPAVERLKGEFGARVQESALGELCRDAQAADLTTWLECYLALMGAEVASCHGGWVAQARPELGPITRAGLEFINTCDRTRVGATVARREHYGRQLARALGPRDLLCLPTTPAIAPQKGAAAYDRTGGYYRRTLSMTSIAGVGRLPQVSMPLATVDSAPVGLSLIAARGEDRFLLAVARVIEEHATFLWTRRR